jgi:hypothetical protein
MPSDFDETKGMKRMTIRSQMRYFRSVSCSTNNSLYFVHTDYYETLGLTSMATFEEIKAAHIQLGEGFLWSQNDQTHSLQNLSYSANIILHNVT